MTAVKKKKKKHVSLNEAIELLNEAFGIDPKSDVRKRISKATLYNALYNGILTKYGTRGYRQVDVDELLAVYGPKKAS